MCRAGKGRPQHPPCLLVEINRHSVSRPENQHVSSRLATIISTSDNYQYLVYVHLKRTCEDSIRSSKKTCHSDFPQLIIAPITLSKVNYEIFLQKEMTVCRSVFFPFLSEARLKVVKTMMKQKATGLRENSYSNISNIISLQFRRNI